MTGHRTQALGLSSGPATTALNSLYASLDKPAQHGTPIPGTFTVRDGKSVAVATKYLGQQLQIQQLLVDYIPVVMGPPNYCFTLTFKGVAGHRRSSTKIAAATGALRWFLHCLNTRCFGKGYRRGNHELGLFATFEGLEANEPLHCHGAIRLPEKLSHEKFVSAFKFALRKTNQLGRMYNLKQYRDKGWITYTLKTGPDSFQPEFLRPGTP